MWWDGAVAEVVVPPTIDTHARAWAVPVFLGAKFCGRVILFCHPPPSPTPPAHKHRRLSRLAIQVYFRQGLWSGDDEGHGWTAVDTPRAGNESISRPQIYVSAEYAVWLVAPDGAVFRRSGIR